MPKKPSMSSPKPHRPTLSNNAPCVDERARTAWRARSSGITTRGGLFYPLERELPDALRRRERRHPHQCPRRRASGNTHTDTTTDLLSADMLHVSLVRRRERRDEAEQRRPATSSPGQQSPVRKVPVTGRARRVWTRCLGGLSRRVLDRFERGSLIFADQIDPSVRYRRPVRLRGRARGFSGEPRGCREPRGGGHFWYIGTPRRGCASLPPR